MVPATNGFVTLVLMWRKDNTSAFVKVSAFVLSVTLVPVTALTYAGYVKPLGESMTTSPTCTPLAEASVRVLEVPVVVVVV